jgi:hypothetical protein
LQLSLWQSIGFRRDRGMSAHRSALKILVLAASILVRYDTMEILVYVEPGAETRTAAEFVGHACDVAHSLDLALPTPYRIQWRKQLPSGAVLPDESKVLTGMLTTGACART